MTGQTLQRGEPAERRKALDVLNVHIHLPVLFSSDDVRKGNRPGAYSISNGLCSVEYTKDATLFLLVTPNHRRNGLCKKD